MAYVDASAAGANDGSTWADAYTDLQAALAAARSGGGVTEIWVRAGTYKPAPAGGDQALSFELAPGVGLYGGFAGGETQREQAEPSVNVTVLSGDLQGDDVRHDWTTRADNSPHVITFHDASPPHEAMILDGFTVTGGHAPEGPTGSSGGGVFGGQGQLDVRRCTFRDNFADRDGAGVYADGNLRVVDCLFEWNVGLLGGGIAAYSQDLEIRGCTFRNNSASWGSGAYAATTKCLLTDCLFIDNEGDMGGGAAIACDQVTISNCRFESNSSYRGALALLGESAKLADVALVSNVSTDWGGAIFCGGAVTMERMRIVGNRGANGAAVYTGGSLLIRNALIADNDALGHGGAIYAEDDSPRTFINCTIVNNRAAQATGGGFYSTAGDAEFVNCILWGNADKQGSGEAAQLRTAGGTLAVSHSTVAQWSGALGGAANQGDDPILLQPAVLKYRLSECSPAVNAGDNAAAIDPNAIDLDGAARVYGGAVDMGAYERVYTDDDGDQMPDGCQCRADVDGNGVVNLDDLLITLGNSGLAPAEQADGDVDADGEVDGLDVKRLLAEFGAMCP